MLWYRLLFFNAIHRSKKIITISEFSKKEIIKYYKVKEDKIAVIPCAWQHYERIGYDNNALNKYGLEKNGYYFSMCSLEPNKNFKWIADTAKMNPEQMYVVAGSINKVVFAEGLGFECPENMKLIGYVSDEEAKTLSRDCKGFLFPSIYEGFGIPPLEAISAGCTNVIVSDTEVMREVFGDSVSYINPYRADGVMPSFELDDTVRKRILGKYQWSDSAKAIISECDIV